MRTMPFGKHKGKFLSDIPCDYLDWILENCENLKPNLREAIVATLEANIPKISLSQTLLKNWYRQLAIKYHPDKPTGSVKAMQAINDANELLRSLAVILNNKNK